MMPGVTMTTPHVPALSAENVRRNVDLSTLSFTTTAELEPLTTLVGQERAMQALQVGLGMQQRGYNIFVCGFQGLGARSQIEAQLRAKAATLPIPGDWVYVHNFRHPDQPLALALEAGQGCRLQQDMEQFVNRVRETLPKAFGEEDFENEQRELSAKYEQEARQIQAAFNQTAREKGFGVQTDAAGNVAFIPLEAKLSGSVHDKGILILSGYLRHQYAQDKPLTLSASLCFEQSYGGVDGDSASSTELYALLSSLANLPLRQDLAVTGSVNQWGDIQAIGGVNEKIEGFYDICRQSGLTGTQGVVIPQANARNLMLRPDVVAAVRAGQFHVYPITHVDQGLALLTGVAAGDKGTPDTVHGMVNAQLQRLAREITAFSGENSHNGTHAPSGSAEDTC